jgi:hypothetical protein
MKIGDKMWHPCNMDIIEHKVIGVHEFENNHGKRFKHWTLKAVHNVGACGKIEVVIDEHNDKFRFIELIDEENIAYSSGLQDFVEGNYYTTLEEAKVVFYTQQKWLVTTRVSELERLLTEAKNRLTQIESIIKIAKTPIINGTI